MRINERALNSAGLVAAMLSLLLPFIRLRMPLSTGGLWWTGGDLLAGGGFGEDIVAVRHEIDGSVTLRPVTADKAFSAEQLDALSGFPVFPAAMIAGALILLGAIAAQVLRSHVRLTGAVMAAAAMVALSVAQAQAVAHVTRAWKAVPRENVVIEAFEPRIGNAYGFWVAVSLLGVVVLGNAALTVAQRWSRIDSNIVA